MRNGKISATLVLLTTVLASMAAQAGNLGVAADLALPSGDFNKLYDSGFGIHAIFKRPLTPLVTLTADGGWTSFGQGDLGELQDNPFGGDIDVWNVTAGGTVFLLPLGLGAEYGYFSKVEDWSLVPYAGMGFGKLDLTVRYKATGDAKWWEFRVGVFF